jgi:protein-S-isoprenylcysteine O-methyltransferase Ste14
MIFSGVAALASWALGWPPIPFLPGHELIGIAVFFAGWILPVWGYATLRRAGTDIDPISETNARLVTGGPYALTRNPMYLGLSIAALGLAIWVGAWPMLAAPALTFVVAARVHTPFEETKMRRQFGADYDAYAARVRRWI